MTNYLTSEEMQAATQRTNSAAAKRARAYAERRLAPVELTRPGAPTVAELEADVVEFRRVAPTFVREMRLFDTDGYLTDILAVTDQFAGAVLEMWAEQDATVLATGRGTFLAELSEGAIVRLS